MRRVTVMLGLLTACGSLEVGGELAGGPPAEAPVTSVVIEGTPAQSVAGPMVRVPVPPHAQHKMVYRRGEDGRLIIECVKGHPMEWPEGHPMREGVTR